MHLKSFLKIRVGKKGNQTFRGCHLLFVAAFTALKKREQPQNLWISSFFNAYTYFQKLLYTPYYLRCTVSSIFSYKGHARSSRSWAPLFPVSLFPSPWKTRDEGNVHLQVDVKYLPVWVLRQGGARHCVSLLGRRLKGKAVYKRALTPSFPYLFAFKHLPCTFEVSATTYRVFSRRPYWCPKTMKRRPCWCPKPILSELNSFLKQTLSFSSNKFA